MCKNNKYILHKNNTVSMKLASADATNSTTKATNLMSNSSNL